MVLLQTVGSLEGQALQTGKESTAEVSSKLRIMSITGETNDASNPSNITYLRITARLAPGSDSIDLNETLLGFTAKNTQVSGIYYNMSASNTVTSAKQSTLPGKTYSVVFLGKPSDYSNTNRASVDADETIEIWYKLGTANGLPPSTQFTISIVPQKGIPETIPTSTPSAYTGLYETIFP